MTEAMVRVPPPPTWVSGRHPTTVRGVLHRAADIIEKGGLGRGQMIDARGCRCTLAAIVEACGLAYDGDKEIDTGYLDARWALRDELAYMRRWDALWPALRHFAQFLLDEGQYVIDWSRYGYGGGAWSVPDAKNIVARWSDAQPNAAEAVTWLRRSANRSQRVTYV